jgi:hypothetical protein
MWVLSGDVLGDINNSFCSVLQLLLLSWLDIAVEDLHSVGTDLQLCPAQVGTHGLHQRQLRIGERRCPAAAMALGIAASQPIGMRDPFGSMTKPFHPGGAARAGLMAALLAQQGFTASPKALEAPRGMMQTISTKNDWSEITQGLGQQGQPLVLPKQHHRAPFKGGIRQQLTGGQGGILAGTPEDLNRHAGGYGQGHRRLITAGVLLVAGV